MIVTLGLRGFQLLLSVIVLGLSGSLINGQVEGNAPSQTQFAAACGSFGLLFSLVGLATVFLDMIPWLVTMVLDAVVVFFCFAGGIALAAALGTGSCTNENYTCPNVIIRGFATTFDGDFICVDESTLKNRCQEAQADDAFLVHARCFRSDFGP